MSQPPPQLRRRPDPAGPSGDHVAPLPLSVGHVEGHPAAVDPRIPGRVTGPGGQPVPDLGQLGSAALAAAGRLAADQVDAGDPRRPRHPAQSRRSLRCGPRSSWRVLDELLDLAALAPLSQHASPRAVAAPAGSRPCSPPVDRAPCDRALGGAAGAGPTPRRRPAASPVASTSAYTPRKRSVRSASRRVSPRSRSSPGCGRVGTTQRMVGIVTRNVGRADLDVATHPRRLGELRIGLLDVDQDVGPEPSHVVRARPSPTATPGWSCSAGAPGSRSTKVPGGVENRASVRICLVVNTEVSGRASDSDESEVAAHLAPPRSWPCDCCTDSRCRLVSSAGGSAVSRTSRPTSSDSAPWTAGSALEHSVPSGKVIDHLGHVARARHPAPGSTT